MYESRWVEIIHCGLSWKLSPRKKNRKARCRIYYMYFTIWSLYHPYSPPYLSFYHVIERVAELASTIYFHKGTTIL